MAEPETSDGLVQEQTCEICGARLTARELEQALETGGPFLCLTHAEEELPAIDPDAGEDPPQASP